MNQARAEELRLPYRAEELRREAAYRIQGQTRARRFDRGNGPPTVVGARGYLKAMVEPRRWLRHSVL
jgi:hypothetical protein